MNYVKIVTRKFITKRLTCYGQGVIEVFKACRPPSLHGHETASRDSRPHTEAD